MSDHYRQAGSTGNFVTVKLRSSTTGMLLTGQTFSSMTISGQRTAKGTKESLGSLVAGTLGTFTSHSWVETQVAGEYQYCPPDAAMVSGAPSIDFVFSNASAIDQVEHVVLTGQAGGGLPVLDANGNVQANTTKLANQTVAASGTVTFSSGTIPTVGTGANQIALSSGGVTVGTDSAAQQATQSLVSINNSTLAAMTTTTGTTGTNVNTLLSRLTSARAGYLDNLNVGGNVASHADIAAINQSASKHLLLVTVGQYEPGETYTIEMRTFAAADGSAVNADSTPTLTATGQVSGSLSANLSAATNPATGVYRWTYTPGATPTLEQIRFDGTAVISTATFSLSCYAQTVDEATVVWTATDQSHLTSIYNKLPSGNIGDATAANQTTILGQTNRLQYDGSNNVKSTPQTAVTLSASDTTAQTVATNLDAKVSGVAAAVWDTLTSVTRAAGSYGAKLKAWVLGSDNKVMVSGDSGAVPAVPDGPTDAKVATGLAEVGATGRYQATSEFLANGPSVTGGSGGGSAGTGDIPVNQDTGGADSLRVTDGNGNGIDGASIVAYLTSEWAANQLTAVARGQAFTSTDGRWATPMMLNAGAYTFVVEASGYQTSTMTATVS